MRKFFSASAALAFAFAAPAQPPAAENPAHEAFLFTPAGFEREGRPAWAEGSGTGRLHIIVRDAEGSVRTPCRVNVVGPDGNYYQPPPNRLSPFALTGRWPKPGSWGNRPGKAPFRYIGHFFYVTGETTLSVPAGSVRVEVWKGFEFAPREIVTRVAEGVTQRVELTLERTSPMVAQGYYAGDSHLHFPRGDAEDDGIIFDLLEAEDLRHGFCLAYNEPPGPYAGLMERLAAPQNGGIGPRSIRSRGHTSILSGQEYRSGVYGHLNLYLLEDLVFPKKNFNSDHWPTHGVVGRDAIARGGHAVAAHGGYAREIYADAALGALSAVELLQFGIYRGIGLEDWYHILNTGYRFPALGACDYPPCRTLADCRTYVHHGTAPTTIEWIEAMAGGRSFFTTGPLLLLEVDGQKPGARIHKSGSGPHTLRARVRVRCEVTPVTDLDLIVNGRVAAHRAVPRAEGRGRWLELEQDLALSQSAWIAARAHSTAPIGQPDAESHSNPVYVYLDNRAPYQQSSLDAWVTRIDGLIAGQNQRRFPEREKVLTYLQTARDLLLRIRQQGGLTADADPRKMAGEPADPRPEDLGTFLQPVPAKSPAEALETFEALPGFHLELVAAEPLVRSPVAAAFDEDGNLYVAEMRDYPYNRDQPVKVARQKPTSPGQPPLGTVRLLRDSDGDGRFDQSHVFADELLWPAGIAPWKGGVFVSAPPDIWYLKDTDGDHRADVRRKILSGFGAENQQAMVNNLQFGPDHKIHASTAGNGGNIVPGGNPSAKPVPIAGRDFCFDPDSGRLELESGTRQFGLTFDDWGRRFLCSQADPCFQVVLPLRYIERNPHFIPQAVIANTTSGPTAIHRISPVERWRRIRSSRRVAEGVRPAESAGVSHHVLDAGAGVTVYRGGAYPAEFHGNVFTADGQNNLVHRRRIESHGATFRTLRADEGAEFIRSSDIWFRPVNLLNAPDGTLYCLDMSREYLETVNIPPDVEEWLDLTSGRDQGRIYRIAPNGFRTPPPPRLSRATIAELAAALESPHGWWRDTARRLLFERQDPSAIPALRELAARPGAAPEAQVQALWALEGQRALDEQVIARALSAPHPGVRENALRLAEPLLDASTELRNQAEGLATDPDPHVRLQLAFTTGECGKWNQAALLARLVRDSPDDSWLQSAALSSAAHCSIELLAALRAEPRCAVFLRRLTVIIGARNEPPELARATGLLAGMSDPASALPLLDALGEGLQRAGASLAAADPQGRLQPLVRQALQFAGDAARPESLRQGAIGALTLAPYMEAAPVLLTLIEKPQRANALRLAAIQTLDSFRETRVGADLLRHWSGLDSAARARVLDAVLRRPERLGALWSALENKTLRAADLSALQVNALRAHRDQEVRRRAGQWFGSAAPPGRLDAYKAFLPALELAGNAVRGKAHFEARCAVCHRLVGGGHEFGPDLAAVRGGGREKFLSSVLDPNREVLPQFSAWIIETRDGETLAGILKAESAAAVTLRLPGGLDQTVARARIAGMKTNGQSFMPEGIEAGLTLQDMADLIEYIFDAGR